MRKHFILFIGVICILISVPFFIYSEDYKFVASKYSIKYHMPTCKQALKIQPQVRITFKTVKEARDTGRIPCNKCKPPTKDWFGCESSGRPGLFFIPSIHDNEKIWNEKDGLFSKRTSGENRKAGNHPWTGWGRCTENLWPRTGYLELNRQKTPYALP